jgi:S-adenosylmethionine uptake transporter
LSVALWILSRRGLSVLNTRHPLLQMSRGLVAALSSTCFILAVTYVPLADAVAVSFVAPFMVTVLGALILREPVGIRRWSAITVGFLGMLVVVRPGSGVFHPAMFLVVVAASLFATRQILSRLLGPVDSTATTITYTSLCSSLLLSVPLIFVWQMPQGGLTLVYLGVVAVAAGLGEVLVIRALELAYAVVLAPLQYSMILWSTALGWLMFSQLPDRWTLLGAAIIVASGIYTVHRERLAAMRRA